MLIEIGSDRLPAILETSGVIESAADRTDGWADLLSVGGVYEQWRPRRRTQPRIHLPRGLIPNFRRAPVLARRRCGGSVGTRRPTRRLLRYRHVEPDALPARLRFYRRDVGPSRWLMAVVSYEQ